MSYINRITFSHIKNICSSLFKKDKITPLGRWSVNKNKNHNLIVDYANEDHCGSCGEYINNKIDQEKILKYNEKNLEIEYSSIVLNTPN